MSEADLAKIFRHMLLGVFHTHVADSVRIFGTNLCIASPAFFSHGVASRPLMRIVKLHQLPRETQQELCLINSCVQDVTTVALSKSRPTNQEPRAEHVSATMATETDLKTTNAIVATAQTAAASTLASRRLLLLLQLLLLLLRTV